MGRKLLLQPATMAIRMFYVMPTTGGIPTRITYASYGDRMVDWHPDGERLLFASRREAGIPRVNQFYLVSKDGGFPEKVAVPYGELAGFSPDGKHLAYITKITEQYPFKRYRGGLTSDVIIFDLENNTAENITNNLANDGRPSWSGNKIYFLSDQGENMRRNIWSYDTQSGQSVQITNIDDFDIAYLAVNSSDLVFEAGGILYLMDAGSNDYEPINITVVSDLSVEIPKMKNVGFQYSKLYCLTRR
jgi:tricorn protease